MEEKTDKRGKRERGRKFLQLIVGENKSFEIMKGRQRGYRGKGIVFKIQHLEVGERGEDPGIYVGDSVVGEIKGNKRGERGRKIEGGV